MGSPATSSTIVLTKRDIDLILMVYSYWGLTTDVIARAFWPRSRPASLTHYKRLKQLCTHGYLRPKPISILSPYGISRTFYTVGRRAIPIISHHLSIPPKERRRSTKMEAPANVWHHALASHFRLSVEWAATELTSVSAHDWHNEVDLEAAPVIAVEASRTAKKDEHAIHNIADRAFTLSLADQRSFSFLVEVDRASVSRERTREKLRGYLLHARAEPEQAKPVLWVVSELRRLEAIALWAKEEAAELRLSPTIFALAPFRSISEHSVLTQAIWQVPSLPLPQTLLPKDVLPKSQGQADDEQDPAWILQSERRVG